MPRADRWGPGARFLLREQWSVVVCDCLRALDGHQGDIAQALFVTFKTVEMHLGRAYRKLDLAGRSQLAAALSDRAIPTESELAAPIAGPTPRQV